MAKNKEWADTISSQLRDQGLESYLNLDIPEVRDRDKSTRFQNRARDHFSHFILRLAYCRTDDLRRWFISQEVEAFKWRCYLFAGELSSFTENNGLTFHEVKMEELKEELPKKELLEELLNGLLDTYNSQKFVKEMILSTDDLFAKHKFYKVHFTEALDLVRGRKVFIKDGQCYVPQADLQHLLTYMFKSLLTHNVAMTAKILPNLDEDDR